MKKILKKLFDFIWYEYEKKQKVLENYVEFRNKLMEE